MIDDLKYNDEIVTIEEIGEMDTVDISVTGDQLFYCSGVLVKNSFGLNFTADLELAMITTPEMRQNGVVLIKQLKNRYGDYNKYPKFYVGFDRNKMRFYDLGDAATQGVGEEATATPRQPTETKLPERKRPIKKLDFT